MRSALLVIVLLLSVSHLGRASEAPVTPEVPPALASKIEELVSLGDDTRVFDQLMEAARAGAPVRNSEAKDEFWNALRAELNPAALTKILIPIYAKHYTEQDIDAMLEFKRSPVGRKMAEKQLVVATEMMQATRGLFDEVMSRVAPDLARRLGTPQP